MASGSNNIKVAFLLLCHDKKGIEMLLSMKYFSSTNLRVIVHFDKRQKDSDLALLKKRFAENKNIHFLENRIECKWGEYSLVDATHKMLEYGHQLKDFKADYFYLFSDSCIPTTPFAELQDFLFRNKGKEFIEANNVNHTKWVKDGLQEERYQYYFPYNFISERDKFERSMRIQTTLGIKREKPKSIGDIHFGSQWFCISSKSAEKVIGSLNIKKIQKFFRWSWIPDEFAIQTLVANAVDKRDIVNKTMTYFQFNSLGKPLVFYNDHFELLTRKPFFFARKTSKEATELYKRMDAHTSKNVIDRKMTLLDIGRKGTEYDIFYQLHTAEHKGGKIGRIGDPWKASIERNYKKFTVLTGKSRHLIRAITSQARKSTLAKDYVIYDYLFEKDRLDPISNGRSYVGISQADMIRRDYDPMAFLYQIIHSSDKHVVFCIDEDDMPKVNEVLKWSFQAEVLIIGPWYDDKTKERITRLTENQARQVLEVASEEQAGIINYLAKSSLPQFWENAFWNESHAKIEYIDKSDQKLAKRLSVIGKKIKVQDYLPEFNFKLLLSFEALNNNHKSLLKK